MKLFFNTLILGILISTPFSANAQLLGSGTEEDPYQIATISELNEIRNDLTAHYELVADIDAAFETSDPGGSFWNEGNGFVPIGNIFAEVPFSGSLNGNGYVINGLYIGGFTFHAGLFGYLGSDAIVTNLGLSNVDITGIETAGGIAALNQGQITQCFVTGSIHAGTNDFAGFAGGVVVQNQGRIENTYSLADVSSENHNAAGIAPLNTDTLINNYVSGSITGNNVFPITISTDGEPNAFVSGNVWNSDVITETGVEGTGRTEAEMRQSASFPGFDFDNTWTIIEGSSFPYLRNFIFDSYEDLPGFLESASSIPGRSLAFDNGEVVVQDTELYDNLSELTLEAWVYLNSAKRHGIIEKYNTSPNQGSGFYMRAESNGSILSAILPSNNISVIATAPGGSIPQNEWTHVATTYDGQVVKVFVNGIEAGTASGGAVRTVSNNNRDLRFGNLNWVSGALNGNLDEIRIWDKALTEEELQRNMFQQLNGDEAGLIAYYPLDETEGGYVEDKTGNNNFGALDSGVTQSTETHPYGTFITGSEGWRIMSSPVDGATYAELLAGLWTQGFPGSDSPDLGSPNVLAFDEATNQFQPVTDADDEPGAGNGFIVYVYDDADFDGTPDGFPKSIQVVNTQTSGTVSPSLFFTDSGDIGNNGWNLAGNPYGATIDWDAASGWTRTNLDDVIYIWNDIDGEYQSWNGVTGTLPNEGLIAPWQGFWVKANAADPQLTLTDDVRSAGGTFFKSKTVPVIELNLTGDNKRSSAVVLFSDEAERGKDRLDAYKLQSLNAEYLSLFTQLSDGTALDINALPLELEETISIPVQVDGSGLNGEFQLGWKLNDVAADWQLLLSDNETGEKVDMAEHSGFTFQLSASAKKAGDKSNELAVPVHGIISPKVMKSAGLESSRFTLTIIPGQITELDQTDHLPKEFGLNQNYPNPFNPVTIIDYQLPENSEVRLDIFDMLGRRVATLVNERIDAGYHQVEFNASHLASGVYVYRLQAGSVVFTKKLTLIK